MCNRSLCILIPQINICISAVFILGFAQTYFATLVPESDNATTDTHWSEFLVVGLQRNVFAAVFENKLNFV
jgi:hypothetical protein